MQKKEGEGRKQVRLMKLQSVAASQTEMIGKRKNFSACKFYCNQLRLNAEERREDASQPNDIAGRCNQLQPTSEEREREALNNYANVVK